MTCSPLKTFQHLKEFDSLLKYGRNEKGCFIYIDLLISDFDIDFTSCNSTVERVFSAMNIIKNRLRNRIGDQ